jgi:hypothetical protein
MYERGTAGQAGSGTRRALRVFRAAGCELDTAGVESGQSGSPLPVVYLAWLAVLLILYPARRWFADVKRRRREAWLSYL